MTITSIKMVSMAVQGALLTERARETMGDGDWKGALNFLVDSLEGMSYDQAISVIEGRTRLTGEGSTITMEAEDPLVMAQLQEQYKAEYALGQYVRSNDTMYEPYLVIDNLGPEDANCVLALPEFQRQNVAAFTRYPEWMSDMDTVHAKACYQPILPSKALELRAMHYAAAPKTDKAVTLLNGANRKVVVLFRQVANGVTPFWREKDNDCFAKAFAAAANYLPAGGFAQHYGFIHPDEVKRAPAATPAMAPEVLQELNERLATEEAEAAAYLARKAAETISLRERIVAFADADSAYGWQDYRWRDPKDGTYLSLRAPKRALQCYALSQTSAHTLMPAYQAFSPDSFKTGDDNPYHTDVWLGCGFALDDKTYHHDSREYRAILDLMFEVQRTMLDFQVQVLARGPEVAGKVVFFDAEAIDKTCILVVPHAGVEFELQGMAAGAVVCEAGGRLAHLVTVCREQSKPILRMDGACSTFRAGQHITVHPDTGRITIWPSKLS
jgi:phosphohistidine swiveling domain-containing protein